MTYTLAWFAAGLDQVFGFFSQALPCCPEHVLGLLNLFGPNHRPELSLFLCLCCHAMPCFTAINGFAPCPEHFMQPKSVTQLRPVCLQGKMLSGFSDVLLA